MTRDAQALDAIPDPGVRAVLQRLHRAADRQERGLMLKVLDQAELIEIREGDATETLRELEAPIDLLLCDGFPPGMLPVLKLVAPPIRPGGVVISDNIGAFWAEHSDFLDWLHDPANGFQPAMLAMNEGTELSVKVAAAGSADIAAPSTGSAACAS